MRIALDLMVRDLIQVAQGLPDSKSMQLPSGGTTTAIRRPSPPGTNLSLPLGTTQLNAVLPGYELGPVVRGIRTDMITVLYADTLPCLGCTDAFDAPGVTLGGGGATATVDEADRPVAGVLGGVQQGDLIAFAGNNRFALQMVTATPTGQMLTFGGNDAMNVNQRTAPTGSVLQVGATPDITRLRMISYYIDTLTDPSMPRLIRQVNMNPGTVVAFGIENLKFTYDIADGATNPTNQVNPGNPSQIRKVNIVLQFRSRERNRQTGDVYRASMATQVSFRNMAMVDRYPNS
jgi:hypothetical protein